MPTAAVLREALIILRKNIQGMQALCAAVEILLSLHIRMQQRDMRLKQ